MHKLRNAISPLFTTRLTRVGIMDDGKMFICDYISGMAGWKMLDAFIFEKYAEI